MFWGLRTRPNRNVDSDLQTLLSSLYLKIDYARLAIQPPSILTFEIVVADALCYMQLLKYKSNTTVYSNAYKRKMRSADLVRDVHILVFADTYPPTHPKGSGVNNRTGYHPRRGPTQGQKCTIIEAMLQFIGALEKVDLGELPRSALKAWWRETKAVNDQEHEKGERQGREIISTEEGKSVCECHEEGEISEDGQQCVNCTKPQGDEIGDLQGGSTATAHAVKLGHDPVRLGTARQECDRKLVDLEGHGQDKEHGSAVPAGPLTEEHYRVDQALKKMDLWTDEWLMGISKTDEDWATFGQCLEQPDL
ncbi:hypothetical protein EDD37DRAFT_611871 [Exophiala viscosa]|uniref:uncharacterized protein n=1 Tax=Exophiala viscosa TaxID=2486360 RepID=UPI00218F3FBE|nr:hypothetical protein EDD37DRAFT_611871 [Exophiala viscosa]